MMKASAVCASALLSAVSASAAQSGKRELQSDDVACKVAEYLDERSLIDFSKSAPVFSRGGRMALTLRMDDPNDLSVDPYPGPMIECESEEEWDKLADQIGKSDKRAILTFGDEYAFFRGVPEDAEPGYTGQFIGTVVTRQFEWDYAEELCGKTYTTRFIGLSGSAIRLMDGNFAENPEMLFDVCFSELKLVDSKRIVKNTDDASKLEVFERSPISTEIGDLVYSVPYSDFPHFANSTLRQSNNYDGPELVTVAAKPESESTLLTYSVYRLDGKSLEKPKERTVRLSFHSEEMTHEFSKNGRYIVTLQGNGPMLAITDTFTGHVKERFMHHRRDENFGVSINFNNQYCLMGIHNNAINQISDVFFDLRTGEIIGSAMDTGNDSYGRWIGEHMLTFSDHTYKCYARSVQQPRAVIALEDQLKITTANCIVRKSEVLVGHWERD